MQRRVQSILGTVMQQVECPTCHGYGTVIKHPCAECSGKGRVRANEPVTFTVPAGVNDGARIRLRGKGEAGLNGGPNGDLYIDLRIKSDKYFNREGDDLLTTVNVPMVAAALGTVIPLETFDGQQQVNIPAGSQSGDTVTLPGLGAARLHEDRRGDLRVRIQVTTPTNLNEEQRTMLRQFAELRGEPAGRQPRETETRAVLQAQRAIQITHRCGWPLPKAATRLFNPGRHDERTRFLRSTAGV